MAKRNKMKSILAAVLAAAMIGSSAVAAAPVFAASSDEIQGEIDELEAQQESLQAQQDEVASQLASLKEDKQKQLEYKQALDSQMVSIQKEINVINKKIKKLDKQIKAKKAEIKENEKNITATFSQLKERIHDLYLAGEASDLELLLSAESITDFADKVEVMRSITDHDSDLIDKLKDELNKVKAQKEEIEKDRQEVSDAKTEMEGKKKEVAGLVEESNAVIASIRASEAEANSLASQLESEFNATSDSLSQKYEEYQAAKTAEQRAAEAAAAKKVKQVTDDDYDAGYTPPSNDVTETEETGDNGDSGNGGSGDSGDSGDSGSSDFVQGDGVANSQFVWPAPGTTMITSGVGPRWGTTHNGIDISGGNAYGSPIVAADGGTVIVAVHEGWGGGYGLHVMIDHGNGYVTVYGHASQVFVNEGDKVSQGQTIALIGSTGDSTGPHLHFEIRNNGAIMDPENYVSP